MADDSYEPDLHFLPMNLRWSDGREIYAEGISPRMGKHCDLGHIVDPQRRKWTDGDLEGVDPKQTLFALDLELNPNTQSRLLAAGRYHLNLLVAAANCAPVPVKRILNKSQNQLSFP
jgi:hypothetical protein